MPGTMPETTTRDGAESWRPAHDCQLCRLGSVTVEAKPNDIRAHRLETYAGESLLWVKPHRSNVVQGDGPVPCPIMLIGEAPGFREDATGLGFRPEAPAGRVLLRAMDEVGLCRVSFSAFGVPVCTIHGELRGLHLHDGRLLPASGPKGSTPGEILRRAEPAPSSLLGGGRAVTEPLETALGSPPTHKLSGEFLSGLGDDTHTPQTFSGEGREAEGRPRRRASEGHTSGTFSVGGGEDKWSPPHQKTLQDTQALSILLGVGCFPVYTTNSMKCRPVDNRIDKFLDCLEFCRTTFLEKEIAAVKPKVIVLLGKSAAQPYFGKESSLILRQEGDGPMLIHAPHPSYIARGAVEARVALVEALKLAKEVGYGD